MNTEINYVDALPKINPTSGFILLESIKNDIAKLWYEFMQKIILISMTQDEYFKTISDALKDDMQLHNLKRSYARNILGIGKKLCVIEIVHNDGITSCKELISFKELITMYMNSNEETFKRVVIDRFLIFLWNKKVLLYPIVNKAKNYQRPSDWSIFVDNTEILDFLIRKYEKKEESPIKSFFENAIIAVLSSTRWTTVNEITNDDISMLETLTTSSNSKNRTSYTPSILNEIRLLLIDMGREDILKPKEAIEGRKNYDKKRKFNFIDIHIFPNLKYLKSKAIRYYDVLEKDGLATATIQGELSAIVNFFDYLMEYYPDGELNIKTIEEIFNPSNEVNLLSMLLIKQQNAKATLNKIVKFLVHCELFSMKAKINIPRNKNKVSRQPYRTAMPKEMIRHIVDIIKNRPPLLKTSWNRNKANISWWEFEVYPIYPLMMLFGYYIPVRGEQVRNLCREKSFIIKEGEVETIVINTDKNVNRKNYQEIPCVWEDLQIFVPFLKWHKEYYKNIPLVKYHNDINSPWEDISPLFNTPQYLEPVSQKTHYAYHKKILCQYQLELMEEARKNNSEYFPIVAWAKEGKNFFESIVDLNRCSIKRLDDIEIMYDLHSLRVTGATRYLESGLGINLVMQLTGHTTPDTLMRVYINLTMDEKKEKLKSAIKNIYFGNSDNLIQNTSDLIKGEFVDAYNSNKESLDKALSQNQLFSLNRKLPDKSTHSEYILGVEIARNNHPSTWSPMVHGICPAVQCPDGRENKCSLCPYLITGKLFINGITLKANQALAKFQRDSLQKEEEELKKYRNPALANSLELLLEEILGWWDIMDKINKSLFMNNENKLENGLKGKVQNNKYSASAFAYETYETELTYLANAYDAKLLDVEQDKMGLKILTIKAMKLANQNKDNESFNKLATDELKSIDYLMNFYTNKEIKNNNFVRFIDNIKYSKNITI
jgi:hypothetical protein